MKRFSVAALSSSTPALATVSRDGDVVKRGCLYVKRPPSDSAFKLRLKTWQKRYLVLRDSWTDDNDTSLELYACSDADSTGACKCHTVSLRHVMLVDVYHDSKSFPHAFIVFRPSKSPLIFGAKTDREMREWMMAIKLLAEKLTTNKASPPGTAGGVTGHAGGVRSMSEQCQQQQLLQASRRDDITRRSSPQLQTITGSISSAADTPESYPVSVEAHNDHGKRFSQHEEYVLTINNDCLTLRPSYATSAVQYGRDGDVIVRWRLADIRKMKCESVSNGAADLITLVAARSGSRDLVTYTFGTKFGLAIVRCVKRVDSQTAAARQSTRSNVRRPNHRPAKLANCKLTSSSFDSLAADAERRTVNGCISRSNPDLLSPTDDSVEWTGSSALLNCSNNSVTTTCSRSGYTSSRSTSRHAEAAFCINLATDDNATDKMLSNRHVITTKSLSDVTGNNASQLQTVRCPATSPPRPPPRPLHTMSVMSDMNI